MVEKIKLKFKNFIIKKMEKVNKEYHFKYVSYKENYDIAIKYKNGMVGMITTLPYINLNEFYFIKFIKDVNIWEFELIFKDIYILKKLGNLDRLKKSYLTKIINNIIN